MKENKTQYDKDSWIVPYMNLITIFMILFLILFVFAFTGSKVRYEKMLLSIENSLGKEKQAEFLVLDVAEKLDQYISKKGLQQAVTLEVLPDKIKIILLTPIVFDIGSAKLKPLFFMEEIRNMLKVIPNNVLIEGHTCDLPVSSQCKYKSNLELSGARAFSLLKYMIDGGLKPERFRAMGCGANVPKYLNDSEENRMMNRRVEISIMR